MRGGKIGVPEVSTDYEPSPSWARYNLGSRRQCLRLPGAMPWAEAEPGPAVKTAPDGPLAGRPL